MMDSNQYMGMFLEESREHLQTLNSCVLDLENDPENLSVLSEIFRSAHTIKGMSATMGFTTIAELTHEMENIAILFFQEFAHEHVRDDELFLALLGAIAKAGNGVGIKGRRAFAFERRLV